MYTLSNTLCFMWVYENTDHYDLRWSSQSVSTIRKHFGDIKSKSIQKCSLNIVKIGIILTQKEYHRIQ